MKIGKQFRAVLLMSAIVSMTAVWMISSGGSTSYHYFKTTLGIDGDVIRATTTKEMSKRMEEMNRICTKYNVSSLQEIKPPVLNRRNTCDSTCPLLLDEKYQLIMCHIQKVGSTMMKTFFLNIQNKSFTMKNGLRALYSYHLKANKELLRISTSYLPKEMMDTFFKGLIVRHPFDRLVSTFSQQITTPINNIKKKNESVPRKTKHVIQSNVSFREFIRFLIRTNPRKYNIHWMPYWSRCDLCHTKYDFFARLETAAEDMEFILQSLGIKHVLISKLNSSTRNDAMKYFKDLSAEEIVALYKIYFLDFKLFGYSVETFLPNGTDIAAIDNSLTLQKQT